MIKATDIEEVEAKVEEVEVEVETEELGFIVNIIPKNEILVIRYNNEINNDNTDDNTDDSADEEDKYGKTTHICTKNDIKSKYQLYELIEIKDKSSKLSKVNYKLNRLKVSDEPFFDKIVFGVT